MDIGQQTSDGGKSKNNISTPQGGGHNTSTTWYPGTTNQKIVFTHILLTRKHSYLCLEKLSFITYMSPVMKIWQINPPTCIDMRPWFNRHGSSWFHISHGRVVRMGIHQPHTYWDIVCVTWYKTSRGPLKTTLFYTV